MKTIKDRGAQGDVMFRRIATLPDDAVPVPPATAAHIVTHSETGHHHVVQDMTCGLYSHPKSALIGYLQLGDGCAEIGGADVIHQRPWDTHEVLRLLGQPGDIFEIRRQREWAPEGWRRVQD